MESKIYKLGDIAEIIVSSIDKKSKDDERMVKLCNFVDVYHNWAITESMVANFMTATANNKNIEKFSLKRGYVAFTKDSETRDDIGISTYIADDLENTVLGYHCALVKPNEKILSGRYLNVFLHTDYIKRYFELNATGSGMRYTLSTDTLSNIPVSIPSLEIQERIGNIFSDIDRKICLNRTINHNLEAIAKQLYDYWFVQFDFPNEEGRPYKSSGGKMVWNEKLKREIPKEWEYMSVGDYAKCKSGFAFKSSDFCEHGNEVIKIGNIQENYTLDMTNCQCIKDDDIRYLKANPFDVVIAMTGATIGKFAIVSQEYFVNQRVGLFDLGSNPLKKLPFLINSLKQNYFRAQIFQIASGCAQPNISAEEINNIFLLNPGKDLIDAYNQKCMSIFNNMKGNILQIRELTKQRDELLPLFINGQVTVNYDLSAD